MATPPPADDDALSSLLWASDEEENGALFLRDAMAFLGATEPDSAPPHAKRLRPTEPQPPTKIPTVSRRRQEITQLRKYVASLEEEVTSLRKRRQEEATGSSARVVDTAALWEALAARQRELRDQVTRENERLKRSLHEMLRQRDALAVLLRPKRADTFGDHRLSSQLPRGPSSSSTLFADMMASLHEQYVVTPYVLATASSVPSYNPLQSSYHASITPRKTLEQVEHVIYPFRYGDTVPTVWETLSGVTNDQPGINYNSVDLRDDSFRLELTIDVQLERKCANFHLQTVAKRIVDSRRTVIVWTGIAVPRGVGGKSMDGISIRQRGWAVVEPVASSELASGSTGEATRSMTYVEDEILIEDGVKKKASNMALLQQFLMGMYAREGGARRQLTENKLVEKTMRAGRVMAA